MKTPKNKYYKGCKITESDFEEIVKLFCADFSIKEIIDSKKFHYDRKTIYDLIAKIREQIHIWMCEKNYNEEWMKTLYDELSANEARGIIPFKNDKKPVCAYFLLEIGESLYTYPLEGATVRRLKAISGKIRNTKILKENPIILVGIYNYTDSKYRKVLTNHYAEKFNLRVQERLKREFGFNQKKFQLILSESEFKHNTKSPFDTILTNLTTNPLTKRI